jgi:ABC-2 type transport system permease protein
MRRTLLFALREYKAAVKTKGFVIGLLIAPLMMGGSLIAFLLLKDRVDTADKHLGVVDRSGVLAQELVKAAERRNANDVVDPETGKKMRPAYYLQIIEPNTAKPDAQRLELSNRVRAGELHAFLDIGPRVVHPAGETDGFRIGYYARNPAMDDLRHWISGPINEHLRKVRLAEAGIRETQVPDLFDWINAEGLRLVSIDDATGGITDARTSSPLEALLAPVIIMMLMFLMIMMSVPGMLNSVMEEKTQRIAEVVLGSIRPFEFMSAKLLGGIAVSLTSSAVYVIGGTLMVYYIGYEQYVPFHMLPWFFVFMLLAIVMYGALSAALGSTCSEAKDAQSLSFATILPVIFPMFVYFPVVREPMGSLATWLSLFPPFTPVLMVLRLATPESIPVWQPVVGLLGVLACTVFFVWVGGRIFRVAILLQGTPPKLANVVRWAIRG